MQKNQWSPNREINWIKCKFSVVVIATNVTLYLLTVLDGLKVIQCITLVSIFFEISIGNLKLFEVEICIFSLIKKL